MVDLQFVGLRPPMYPARSACRWPAAHGVQSGVRLEVFLQQEFHG